MKPISHKKRVHKRLESLRTERSPFLTDWRDTNDFVLGVRGKFLSQSTQLNKHDRNDSLYNEHALFASQILASGMMAGITSPARPWFKLITPDADLLEYGPVKIWLDRVEKIILEVFARSNFYNSMATTYLSLGVNGVAAVGQYQDFDNVSRFETYPIGSYMLGLDGKRNVDTIYREYVKSVGSLVKEFGFDKVSPTTRKLYEQHNLDTEVPMIHVVEPNDGRKYDSPLSRDMMYRSLYFEEGQNSEQPIKFAGFEERPFYAPRWAVIGDDTYPYLYPGINSIGTNKSLQIEELDYALAREKMHNPPLIGDSALEGYVDNIAGGVSFAPGMSQSSRPALASVYDVNPRIGELNDAIKDKENRIDRHFFADLFLMISNLERAQITAFEIDVRQQEKLLMLGPVLERLNPELLDPCIDRTFNMLNRAGVLPPPPPELENIDLKVEYVSMLHQAQKTVATKSIENTAQFVEGLMAINPNAGDKIDTDQMIDEYAKAKGAPPKIVRTDDDAAAIRAQRAEQQAQQQAQERAAAAAEGAAKLGNTPMDQGSALDGVMDSLNQ